jgi:hypothetical protein
VQATQPLRIAIPLILGDPTPGAEVLAESFCVHRTFVPHGALVAVPPRCRVPGESLCRAFAVGGKEHIRVGTTAPGTQLP